MINRRGSRSRGTIEPRGDAWLVRVTLGEDLTTGRRARLSQVVRGTRTDAQKVLTDLLSKHDRGAPLPRSRMTLGDWLDEHAAVWSGALGPQTRENAAQALRCYVTPALRALRLVALRPAQFQALYNDMAGRGLAPATISNLHRVLKSRLSKARALGHVASNPLDDATPPADRRREYRVLSPTEARLFLEEAARDDLGALWALLLTTGLRPEEALGVTWDDLDGERLAVRRALVRLAGGSWQLEETKTRRARTVTLPATTARALTRHKARQATIRLQLGAEYAGHGLIFASGSGKPLFWDNVVRRHFRPTLERVALRLTEQEVPTYEPKGMKRAARKAAYEAMRAAGGKALRRTGLDRMRPYDLRHSAATLLLAAGEHPKVVAELLGHAKVTLTLDTYSHVTPGMLDQAANRMESIVIGAPGNERAVQR